MRIDQALRQFLKYQGYWTGLVATILYSLAILFIGYAFFRVIYDGRAVFLVLEIGSGFLILMGLIGICLNAMSKAFWLARWGFLLISFGGVLETIAFWAESEEVTGPGTIGISLLLLTGVVVSTSMHIRHGGKYSLDRILMDDNLRKEDLDDN